MNKHDVGAIVIVFAFVIVSIDMALVASLMADAKANAVMIAISIIGGFIAMFVVLNWAALATTPEISAGLL